jgi:hypothetical protein
MHLFLLPLSFTFHYAILSRCQSQPVAFEAHAPLQTATIWHKKRVSATDTVMQTSWNDKQMTEQKPTCERCGGLLALQRT